jgi:hypothetical protein
LRERLQGWAEASVTNSAGSTSARGRSAGRRPSRGPYDVMPSGCWRTSSRALSLTTSAANASPAAGRAPCSPNGPEAEQRQHREAQQRREPELDEQAANNHPRGGVPADLIPDGVSPAAAMLQAAKDAEPRRQSVLEEALTNRDGAMVYHPVDREPT